MKGNKHVNIMRMIQVFLDQQGATLESDIAKTMIQPRADVRLMLEFMEERMLVMRRTLTEDPFWVCRKLDGLGKPALKPLSEASLGASRSATAERNADPQGKISKEHDDFLKDFEERRSAFESSKPATGRPPGGRLGKR